MRDLLVEPLWRAQDLGRPIPDSEHAVSVALPLWEHVIGYEEEDPAVIDALKCGYPRFFCHPRVTRLFAECEGRFAKTGERCLTFPSEASAQRCAAFIQAQTQLRARVDPLGINNVHSVTLPEQAMETAKLFWRYSGEIVSSRLAQASLAGRSGGGDGQGAKRILRSRIADLTGQPEADVYLFCSGMAAVFTTHRMIQSVSGGAMTVQLEFPYVDVLKVQNAFGPGAHFVPLVEEQDLLQLEKRLETEKIAGVYCEIPSNSLLRSLDLDRLSAVLKARGAPLIIDDTVGTNVNLNAFKYADVVTTSLTKYFCGVGDVMAGSVVLNRRSPFHSTFAEFLAGEYEDLLWDEDAVALEAESQDYPERIAKVNATAEKVFDHLADHPKIEKAWYPKTVTPDWYNQIKRDGKGYGGLFSVLLKNAARTTAPFYDALRVSKGPSLGTNYTLACPYTLLAHYQELDWAESCGVSRYLVRFSIGLEEANDLIQRVDEALGSF